MAELGLSLSDARLSRGLSLEDVERGTHISRRFIAALEAHEYTIFPAPIYARGFLRTYCRYLDLDPEPELNALPPAWAAPVPKALPPVEHPIDVRIGWLPWAIAGVIAVVVVAYFMFQGSGGGLSPQQAVDQPSQPQTALGSQDRSAIAGDTAPVSPTAKSLVTPADGSLPNFAGVELNSVLDYLRSANYSYLIIQTPNPTVVSGLVISQSPAAGARVDPGSKLTLTVSSGTTSPSTARTDCAALQAATSRTNAEQSWFQSNCLSTGVLPDRTSCSDIRGTDYRSASERQFFLANCVTSQ
ncbi:MAG TPA: helix-turn-helix domain-containing protein [Dehalococcoidia bacterium]|nr:helix-turn-helix domain-containing protein [Dehalococcoidia bacterium]